MQKLIESFTTTEQVLEHQRQFGRYNDAPPNFKEITEAEFSTAGFFTWCHAGIESRQVHLTPEQQKQMLSPLPLGAPITMFYMNHGDHFAMGHDYEAKKVRYFKFALCYHTYRELGSTEAAKLGLRHMGNCYHICQCTKCGDIYEYDSSG